MQGENGHVVKAGESTELCKAMIALCGMSSGSIRQIGENNRRLVEEKYSLQRSNEKFSALLSGLL